MTVQECGWRTWPSVAETPLLRFAEGSGSVPRVRTREWIDHLVNNFEHDTSGRPEADFQHDLENKCQSHCENN